jgi:hypothetical protein
MAVSRLNSYPVRESFPAHKGLEAFFMDDRELKQYHPKSHHLRYLFRQNRIPQILLINYLSQDHGIRLSQSTLSHWLCGYTPMPNQIQAALQKFVDDHGLSAVEEGQDNA